MARVFERKERREREREREREEKRERESADEIAALDVRRHTMATEDELGVERGRGTMCDGCPWVCLLKAPPATLSLFFLSDLPPHTRGLESFHPLPHIANRSRSTKKDDNNRLNIPGFMYTGMKPHATARERRTHAHTQDGCRAPLRSKPRQPHGLCARRQTRPMAAVRRAQTHKGVAGDS